MLNTLRTNLTGRLPRHGLADRRVENLTPLKAEELRDCADTGVDIGCGLGEKVYVAGLSAGGTMAAWVAQNRGEVARMLLIAPALGLTLRENLPSQWAMALLFPLMPREQSYWEVSLLVQARRKWVLCSTLGA